MASRIARQRKTRKARIRDRRERRKEQGKLQAEIDEAIAKLVMESIEGALEDEVTTLLGRAKWVRRDPEDMVVVEARCNKCGTHYRNQFSRAGTYQRGLLTYEAWGQIHVPRISCACGGMVDFEFAHLVPYGRLWFDVEERARELAGICVSLRDGVEVLAWRNGQPVSIATANRLVNKVSVLAEGFHAGKLKRVPAVAMLDGLWLKVLEPTGESYVDKKGRHRQRLKVKRFALLVAYGVDPQSGERWLLDWERGKEEDEESWRKLLERLLDRGLCGERGLEMFVHDGSAGLEKALEWVHFGKGVLRQRCIFHKLRNVGRDVVGEEGMSRKERQERRKEVVEDASQVYEGKDEKEIKELLDKFHKKWVGREPKAVATLEREFGRTIVYLQALERGRQLGEGWKRECLRTTSPLERVQRHFRQKARQVVVFHAEKGFQAAIELVISHRGLTGSTLKPWARLLEERLLLA